MRHRVASKQLNRDTKHREALAKNMVRALVEHGRIQTTMTKAKVIQRIADKLVTKAKQNTLAARRGLHQVFGKRDVVNTLVDRVAPTFTKRTSGYTRITSLGKRAGDNTLMVELAWVDAVETTGLKAPAAASTKPKATPKKDTKKPATSKKATKTATEKKSAK